MNIHTRFYLVPACLLCLCLFVSGCSIFGEHWYGFNREPIAHGVKNLRNIAIAPVTASTEEGSFRWTNQLQKALLQVEGMQIVNLVFPNEDARMKASSHIQGDHKNLQVPEGSQGILRMKVLDFDPYYPPSAHIQIDLYVANGAHENSESSILELDRHGMGIQAQAMQSPNTKWVRFQKVYKADDPKTAYAIESYSRRQGDKDRALSVRDRIIKDSDRYIEFVLQEGLKDAFQHYPVKPKKTAMTGARHE